METQLLGVVVDDLALHQDKADEALVTTGEALGSVGGLCGNVALLGLGSGLSESAALVGATVLTLSLGALRVHVTTDTSTEGDTRVEESVGAALGGGI